MPLQRLPHFLVPAISRIDEGVTDEQKDQIRACEIVADFFVYLATCSYHAVIPLADELVAAQQRQVFRESLPMTRVFVAVAVKKPDRPRSLLAGHRGSLLIPSRVHNPSRRD